MEGFADTRTPGHMHRENAYCVEELLITIQETIRLQTVVTVAKVNRVDEDDIIYDDVTLHRMC
jgi:hypothetical protein